LKAKVETNERRLFLAEEGASFMNWHRPNAREKVQFGSFRAKGVVHPAPTMEKGTESSSKFQEGKAVGSNIASSRHWIARLSS